MMTRQIPQHIAIIMDGNGRWAQRRGVSRSFGHKQGVDTLETVLNAVAERGIPYLTVYAFSTENWQRPKSEVDYIMQLLAEALCQYTDRFVREGVRLRAIGDLDQLPPQVAQQLRDAIEQTREGKHITLTIALSYSAYTEVSYAIRQIVDDVQSGRCGEADLLRQDLINDYLYTRDMPMPDLLIRTGGEQRLSNFLLLQMAYTELYFTDILWPDFDETALDKALEDYASRQRRFGKIDEDE